MNKVTAALLAAAMVVPMAMPVFATATVENDKTMTDGTAATSLEQSGETKLSYTIPESYKWTIPGDITFTADTDTDTATASVGVTECYIKKDSTLDITVAPRTSGHAATTGDVFVLDSGEGATFTYKVEKNGVALAKGEKALTVTGGDAITGSQELTFTLTSGQERAKRTAGTYTGYVQFTANVTPKAGA